MDATIPGVRPATIRSLSQKAGNGAVLGLSTALFATAEVVALTSFLRPPSWRSARLSETLAVFWSLFGSIAIPAVTSAVVLITCGILLLRGRYGRPVLHVLALCLAGAVVLVAPSFWLWFSGYGFRFNIGVRLTEGLAMYPLAILPTLVAARATDLWSRETTGRRIWQLRAVKVMNVASALLIGASIVFVAVVQVRAR